MSKSRNLPGIGAPKKKMKEPSHKEKETFIKSIGTNNPIHSNVNTLKKVHPSKPLPKGARRRKDGMIVERFNAWIPSDLLQEIKMTAVRERRTISDLLVQALEQYTEKKKG